MSDEKPLWTAQNPFVRRMIPVAAAAGMSLTFTATACKTTNNQNKEEVKPAQTTQVPKEPPKDAWKTDGQITEKDFQDFCQRYFDCDPESFSSSYESVDECATQRKDDLEQYAMDYQDSTREECQQMYRAYQERYLGAYACTDGTFELDESREEELEKMLEAFETCRYTGTITVSESVIRKHCDGLFACEGQDNTGYENIEECVSSLSRDLNATLVDYENSYGIECAQAQGAYYELSYGSYVCSNGVWEAPDDIPGLDALEAQVTQLCEYN